MSGTQENRIDKKRKYKANARKASAVHLFNSSCSFLLSLSQKAEKGGFGIVGLRC